MSKTFNLYCDESTHLIHDGHPYMLLSYISIAYPQIRLAKEEIKAIKRKFNYTEELKWTNVHSATYKVYAELVDWFFMNDLEFRAVVVDKSQIDEKRADYSFNDFYFRMYFQLLHTKVDFQNRYNVFLDIKDTCSGEKKKTYIYDMKEEYVIVLEQQRSKAFYLLTAYHLNKEYGKKALEKKMKKRIEPPL